MSRELSPAERRVCRIVFAILTVTVVAFLLLSAIDYLLHPPRRARTADNQPDITSSVRARQPPSPSSPLLQAPSLPHEKELLRAAVQEDSAPVAVADATLGTELLKAAAVERQIRFDPRPLQDLGAAGLAPAAAVPGPRGSPASQPEEMIATATIAAAFDSLGTLQEASAAAPPAPVTEGERDEPALPSAPSLSADVRQIQSRLHELGFLSSAPAEEWDSLSRDALRAFKVVNRLANDSTWDAQTSEKLNAPAAVRADQSFIGNWSATPCRSATADTLRLSISLRRAKSSGGSLCEFQDFAFDKEGWRVRAACSQGKQHWSANGKLSLKADKLLWASDADTVSYFRCN
jgi:hypothetical protein